MNAQELYNQRMTRVLDAVALKKPDRVPLIPQPEAFPIFYAGLTMQECMEDYYKVGPALDKFYRDFPEIDLGWGPSLIYPDAVMDACGIEWLRWPGHGIDEPHQMYQFIEGEYMKTDEYDAFIEDPTHYIQSTWIPRCFSKLKGLENLRLRDSIWMNWMGSFAAFNSEDVLSALDALKKTAEELIKWFTYIGEYEGKLANEMGWPIAVGANAFAPFDQLGDTMRGTVNVMIDILERPEKVLAAVEKLIPISIEIPVSLCKANGRRFVWFWLHKGVDQFMSDEQFKTFYWPGLKAQIEALVAEDLIPVVYCEGSYNDRLEVIRDVPKGKVIYDFEMVDMFRAKEVLGDVACIAGNVPNAMLAYASAEEVDEYCKKLIRGVGKDGGFILDAGALIDNAKPENLRAMFESVDKYS